MLENLDFRKGTHIDTNLMHHFILMGCHKTHPIPTTFFYTFSLLLPLVAFFGKLININFYILPEYFVRNEFYGRVPLIV